MGPEKRASVSQSSIAVIGCGHLGAALARGFRQKLGIRSERLTLCDRGSGRAQLLAVEIGAQAGLDLSEVVQGADIIVLAVKPAAVPGVLGTIKKAVAQAKVKPLVISVASGVTVQRLKEHLGADFPVVRVMPNLPSMIGVGVSGIYAEVAEHAALAETLFSAVGRTVTVASESDIDAITALGASAPAFIFVALEALADGGVKMGLSREVAQLVAAQMCLGSASMALESGLHPAQLKDRVASPGGTTIAGLHVLEREGFRATLISAVEASALKAKERA